MKFQKTLVAVAMVGIAAVPTIASADTTLSGVVQIQALGSDADGDDGDIRIGAGDVLVGVTSEQQITGGLTGYSSLRLDFDRLSNDGNVTVDPGTPNVDDDDTSISSAGSADSIYVGIKGGFGDLRFGEIPLAVEVGQKANDIFDIGGEINGGISYQGTFGPVSLLANWSPDLNSEVLGVGASFSLGGFSIGIGTEEREDLQNSAVGASFGAFGAAIAAHFSVAEADNEAEDLDIIAVKIDYGIAGFSTGLTFTNQSTDDDTIDDDVLRLDVVYDLGSGMDVSARIDASTDNTDQVEDLVAYRVQLSKAF